MTVTIDIYDVQQPTGELDVKLFPLGDMDDLLEGWLLQAKTKVEANSGIATVSQNEAALAWVYYRGYSYIAQRMASEAASLSLDSTVTKSVAIDQREYFIGKATEWRTTFSAYDNTLKETTRSAFVGSAMIDTRPRW